MNKSEIAFKEEICEIIEEYICSICDEKFDHYDGIYENPSDENKVVCEDCLLELAESLVLNI